MSTVEDIEQAVFEAFAADRFDRRIEADAKRGALDGFAEEAAAELRDGTARALSIWRAEGFGRLKTRSPRPFVISPIETSTC